MSLVFRSVWRDDSIDAVVVLDDEFRKWALAKTNLSSEQIPYRGTVTAASGAVVDIRRADTEQGVALQCVLREVDEQKRQWTTTAIAMTVGTNQTFWVDLECVSEPGLRLDVAAPRLVRNLLKRSPKPVADGLILDAKVEMVQPAGAAQYAGELSRPDRRLPIVTFSPDRRFDAAKTFERAEVAAQALAGVAQVFVLSPKAELEVQKHMPAGFWVYGGAVRLYVPPVDFENQADTVRHPYLARHTIEKHTRTAASALARRIANLNLHPPVPEGWAELQQLLRRPSEEEIREKIEENKAHRGITARTGGDAATEIEMLEMLLAEADLLLDNARRDAEIRDARIVELEYQHIDDIAELEDATRTIEDLQRNFRLLQRAEETEGQEMDDDPALLEAPDAIEDVVVLAQMSLQHLSIPDDAPQNIDDLDEGHKGRVWAKTTWIGLLELNEYARAKSTGRFTAGFRDWCAGPGNWSLLKLSMTESATVKSDSSLWDKRYFPIDNALSDTGRRHMEAHLKIQVGGGNSIPRLYFLDDTDGQSKKVHVGFIGPHYLVPNTKS